MGDSNFKVLGMPMQRQQARRRLVVAVYGVLATICGLSVASATRYPLLYSYAIYAAMIVVLFVFGGQGQRGLLKGFANKPPRPEAPMIEIVRLQLAPQTILTEGDSTWRNDERELRRRDLAHYRAYQPLTLGVMVLLLLSAFALRPGQHAVSARMLLVAIFAVAEAMTMLVLTLPAAMILWTEPDMDLEREFVEEPVQ